MNMPVASIELQEFLFAQSTVQLADKLAKERSNVPDWDKLSKIAWWRDAFSRLMCRVFGHRVCDPTEGVELCERCGDHAAYYLDGSQWTDRERCGAVEPLRVLWRRVQGFTWPRCQKCGRLMLFRRRYAETFCSDKCFTEWLPF